MKTALLLAALLAFPTLAAAAEPAHAHQARPAGLPADQALQNLRDGNRRFVDGTLRNDERSPEVRRGLAAGQRPDAIVVTCADSRVPPEELFDQGLGRLFTVRVAGNVVDENEIASIEYAVEHLGTRLIVVMGHESCGAVRAALDTPRGKSAGSPSLDALVEEIHGCMAGTLLTAADKKDPRARAAVHANVRGVVRKLLRDSKIVASAVESGAVRVQPAVYSLETGEVRFD